MMSDDNFNACATCTVKCMNNENGDKGDMDKGREN